MDPLYVGYPKYYHMPNGKFVEIKSADGEKRFREKYPTGGVPISKWHFDNEQPAGTSVPEGVSDADKNPSGPNSPSALQNFASVFSSLALGPGLRNELKDKGIKQAVTHPIDFISNAPTEAKVNAAMIPLNFLPMTKPLTALPMVRRAAVAAPGLFKAGELAAEGAAYTGVEQGLNRVIGDKKDGTDANLAAVGTSAGLGAALSPFFSTAGTKRDYFARNLYDYISKHAGLNNQLQQFSLMNRDDFVRKMAEQPASDIRRWLDDLGQQMNADTRTEIINNLASIPREATERGRSQLRFTRGIQGELDPTVVATVWPHLTATQLTELGRAGILSQADLQTRLTPDVAVRVFGDNPNIYASMVAGPQPNTDPAHYVPGSIAEWSRKKHQAMNDLKHISKNPQAYRDRAQLETYNQLREYNQPNVAGSQGKVLTPEDEAEAYINKRFRDAQLAELQDMIDGRTPIPAGYTREDIQALLAHPTQEAAAASTGRTVSKISPVKDETKEAVQEVSRLAENPATKNKFAYKYKPETSLQEMGKRTSGLGNAFPLLFQRGMGRAVGTTTGILGEPND